MEGMDANFYWLFGIVAVLILGLLLIGIAQFINDFSRELKYVNIEINRSTGAERRHWIRRRRRLWLSLLPFVKY